MGYRNAEWALAYRGKLPLSARLVLGAMALAARDQGSEGDGPVRVYHGGHRALARAIGKDGTPTDQRHVRDAIAVLKRAGLVELVNPASRGRKARYRLILPVDSKRESGDNGGDRRSDWDLQ